MTTEHSINPLGHIVEAFRIGDPKRWSMVRQDGLSLIAEPADKGEDKNKFWRKEPRRVVSSAISHLAEHCPEGFTTDDLHQFLIDQKLCTVAHHEKVEGE